METSTNVPILIKEASLEEILWVHERIPEFPLRASFDFYESRLRHRLHFSLVAEIEGELVGFKVGYQSDFPGYFLFLDGRSEA